MPEPANRGRDLVAIVLAVGLATALNMLMFAVLWDALFSQASGLSENATQVITALGSGVVGVLGGYIGGRAVEHALDRRNVTNDRTTTSTGDTPSTSTPRIDTPLDE